MVVEKDGYRLYSKVCELRPGYKRKVYFFAKRKDGWELEDKIPEGFEICISKYTGMLLLKRSHASFLSHKLPNKVKEIRCNGSSSGGENLKMISPSVVINASSDQAKRIIQ